MNDSLRNMILDESDNIEDNHNHDLDHNHNLINSYDIYYYNQIKKIRMSLPWVIITFGLIGNIFILIVFLRKSKKFSSNGFCFCALAISDSFALIFMLMRSMLKLQIVSNVAFTCKIIKYVYHVSLQLSSWCLVLLTIDRLIAVYFIFKYKTWCKKLFVVKLLPVIILSVLVLNVHLLIYVNAELNTNKTPQPITQNPKRPFIIQRTTKNDHFMHNILRITTKSRKIYTTPEPNKPSYLCYVDSVSHSIYYNYFYTKWDIYHAILYGILPFFIILTCNILIICKLAIIKNSKKFIKSPDLSLSTRSLENIDPSFRSLQITIMLLSVAFLFLICTSPISIYMAVFYENLKWIRQSKLEFIKVILRYIGYCNNAINFYIYFSLSNQFRREFLNTIKSCFRCKHVNSAVSLCTTSTTIDSKNNTLPQRSDSFYEEKNPVRKPIQRQKLEFKSTKYESNLTKTSSLDSTNEPFIRNSSSNDAVETFKNNNRKAKLNYYKKKASIPNFDSNIKSNENENIISSQLLFNESQMENIPSGPFINSKPTLV